MLPCIWFFPFTLSEKNFWRFSSIKPLLWNCGELCYAIFSITEPCTGLSNSDSKTRYNWNRNWTITILNWGQIMLCNIFQSIMGQCSGLSNIQPTDIIGIGGQLRDESAKGEWVWRIWVRMQKNCSSNYGLSLNVLCPIKELNLLVIFLFSDFVRRKTNQSTL